MIFRKLCGDEALKNVILCTTMWSSVSPEVGAEREEVLRTMFWKDLIDRGASAVRFDGTRIDALNILSRLMFLRNAPLLQIQRQLADEGKSVKETTAGAYINDKNLWIDAALAAELRSQPSIPMDQNGAADESLVECKHQ